MNCESKVKLNRGDQIKSTAWELVNIVDIQHSISANTQNLTARDTSQHSFTLRSLITACVCWARKSLSSNNHMHTHSHTATQTTQTTQTIVWLALVLFNHKLCKQCANVHVIVETKWAYSATRTRTSARCTLRREFLYFYVPLRFRFFVRSCVCLCILLCRIFLLSFHVVCSVHIRYFVDSFHTACNNC